MEDPKRIDSKILDEDMINLPEEKYLFGDYTLDELLKIFGFWAAFLYAFYSSQIIEFGFWLFLVGVVFITFTLNDLFVKKKNHWRWKMWVILLSAMNIITLSIFPNWNLG